MPAYSGGHNGPRGPIQESPGFWDRVGNLFNMRNSDQALVMSTGAVNGAGTNVTSPLPYHRPERILPARSGLHETQAQERTRRTRRANQAQTSANALARWNAALAQNEADRVAAENAAKALRDQQNGGSGGTSGVASVDRGMFETAGRQAIDRVNAVYAGEDARTRALMAQNTASNTVASQQLAAGLANRYADMQKTQAATTADLAAQGFGVGNSAMGGQYQLEALQNAGNAQQAYMTQMQQMNALNESSRLADNSQARNAYEHGINANVAESYNAALVAAQDAAASAAKSGASSAGKQVIADQRQWKYDEGIVNSMLSGQPNYMAAGQALDAYKGMTGPRIVAARHALRQGLRNPGEGMSPGLIAQNWGGGNRVNRMLADVARAQGTPRRANAQDIFNYRELGGLR